MARYEHLPIYKQAMDVAVHMEKVVAGFSRYHKYTLRGCKPPRSSMAITSGDSRGMCCCFRWDDFSSITVPMIAMWHSDLG